MYHVYLNQAAGVYLFLYFFNFLSLKFQNIKFFITLFYKANKVETWYTHGQIFYLLCTPITTSQNIFVPLFFFYFLSLQLAKIKSLLLQNCFYISLMATAGVCELCSLSAIFCPFFFLSNKNFCHRFLGFYESQSSNSVYTLRVNKYIGKENQDAEINFLPSFSVFIFSISHSNIIHREICVKDFSGITAPRILKFGANVGYFFLHCVRENQPPDANRFLYLSIFLSLQSNFLLQISLLLWEPESSNFLYILRVAKYIVGQKTKMMRFIFTIFFHFSFFHLSLQCNT